MHRAVLKIANWLRERPAAGRLALRCLPDWPATINLPTIGPFRISIRRHRSYWLRDPLTHERFMFGVMQRLIKPGDVCFDVGANIGLYSRFLVAGFKAGKVVAFEPMRDNHEALLRNIALAPSASERIQVMNLALGDRDGEETFQVDDFSSASGTLDRVTGGKAARGMEQYGVAPRTATVTVARLDTLIEQRQVPVPSFIKVDIEGAEILFLRGAQETLRRHRPRLAMEMHDVAVTRQVLELLEELGYHVYSHVLQGNDRHYRRVTVADMEGRSSQYDLHHLVCSADPAEIAGPMHLFNSFPA